MSSTKLFIWLQHILPQHFLSRLSGNLTNSDNTALKNLLIKLAMKKFKITLDEAIEENPKAYQTFNDFFTRKLKSDARPICQDNNCIVSPADGCASQFGKINDGELIQAKGKNFSLSDLLGGDTHTAEQIKNGSFMTIYLSPSDYHRVHLPFDAKLLKMTYIPGKLFSVNLDTANNIDDLFAVNERVVCLFETSFGLMPVVLVGAMLVASIVTEWHGVVAPSYNLGIKTWSYEESPIPFKKGDDIGHFRFGSTVVFGLPESCQLDDKLVTEQKIKMGERIGEFKA
jgi:phosphatidylserine decarboxylase